MPFICIVQSPFQCRNRRKRKSPSPEVATEDHDKDDKDNTDEGEQQDEELEEESEDLGAIEEADEAADTGETVSQDEQGLREESGIDSDFLSAESDLGSPNCMEHITLANADPSSEDFLDPLQQADHALMRSLDDYLERIEQRALSSTHKHCVILEMRKAKNDGP